MGGARAPPGYATGWKSSFLVCKNFCKIMPFVMPQNFEMQDCQWYRIKPIKSYFRKQKLLWKKVLGASLLPQVVLISSIKPISSSTSLMKMRSLQFEKMQ